MRERQYSASHVAYASGYKCAHCGKQFVVNAWCDWGYRYGALMCCSYSCMRAMRAEDIERQSRPKPGTAPRKRPRTPVEQAEIDEIISRFNAGKRVTEIARALGRPYETVKYHIRKAGLVR